MLGWSALILGLVATSGFVLFRRFYYGNDDLLQFSVGRDAGLSWETLSLNVFQHFGPYNRLGHLLVYKFTDLNPAVGLAIVLLNLAVMLAAVLWLMTELRLSPLRRALGLVLIGMSAPVYESSIWFDAGMHILPAMAVTFAVVAAHVRGVRTGAARWHVVAVVLFVLGQLTQERPIFALPIVVLVDVLLLWRDLPWRERLQRLWGLRWPLGALVVAAAAIVGALKIFVVVDSYDSPTWSVTARTMLSALSNFLLPSMVNRPLAEPAGVTVELSVLALVVVLGVLLARLVRGNTGPLLFAAAVFLMYYGFLKFSPLLLEDTITINAERLHNAVYVTVPATIALMHLRFRRPGTSGGGDRAQLPLPRTLQVTGCLVLAGYLVVSNVAYLDRQWSEEASARAYLDQVRASAAEWSDPEVTLVPLLAHPAMATGWSQEFARHDRLLDLIATDFRVGPLGPRPVLIDDTGTVRPAALEDVPAEIDIAGGACSGPSSELGDNVDVFTTGVTGGPLFLKLEYRASADLVIRPSARWDRAYWPNSQMSKLDAGTHTALVPLDRPRLDGVDLQVLTEDAGLCVERMTIVRPVLVENPSSRDEACREVDRFGVPGDARRCP